MQTEALLEYKHPKDPQKHASPPAELCSVAATGDKHGLCMWVHVGSRQAWVVHVGSWLVHMVCGFYTAWLAGKNEYSLKPL
jgi:hypothetical protein